MDHWDVTPDRERRARLGLDEAVFCEGKSLDQIARIAAGALAEARAALLTRLAPERVAALPADLGARLDYDPVSRSAFVGAVAPPRTAPRAAVITAGSSDVPVAREAARTLAYHGERALEIHDVGVAGLWRLEARLEEIRRLPVAIVAAGMDCALPSVLAGLLAQPVVAVPTSAGYGVAAGGRVALDAALASCAPGLVVVNIDNGYGAACAALRMLRLAGQSRRES